MERFSRGAMRFARSRRFERDEREQHSNARDVDGGEGDETWCH
jgi:hypothetical protein